ncbi:glycosyltransferase family 2 protein [Mesonia mobilis]|mgnify:CR=1 FL=1|uniref:Glycosyl transferase n=1 Tax=Mesonia mobilis TaxID=369791 RepID=A0ABQ3BPF4_9FLAO|nr:glycosyltransferase family 2 protein [Mesonia mobilis]GGZ53398.1 glycosyl transferase [Mesonia mobilis]
MIVSVIIVTYNGMQWLERCLASVPESYELVIVDNHSTDDTVAFIEENYPKAKLFKEKQNLGFGQANNKGIRYALKQGADYVYLLNQDAYLETDTIEKLICVYSNFPDYGILSPIHTNKNKTRLDQNFSNYLNYKSNSDFYSDFVLGKSIAEVYEVPFVNAAGWLIPKKTLITVGGFDPIFFHYGEDDNYCQRVKYHNKKIGVVPSAFMVHDREDRIKAKFKRGSKEYFSELEKKLKVNLADINNSQAMDELNSLILKTKRNYLKQLLSFKFGNVNYHKKKLLMLYAINKEIKQSRVKNKFGGYIYFYN